MPHIPRFPASTDGPWRSDRLSELPCIRPGCTVVDCELGAWTELMPGCHLVESTLGDYSYAAGQVDIVGTDIGRFCSIASQVRINPGNHPMDRATQHHCTYRSAQYGFGPDDDAFFAWRRQHRCRIGHDVWIGHGAVILPGVRIGIGAVIGTGAVVTRDIPDYAIAAGVPARVKRRRFSDQIIAGLLATAWWDWDHATIAARIDEMADTAAFVAKYASAT